MWRANPARLAVTVLASAYFLWAALHPSDWRFIDFFNLVMHEAGHVVFMPFGEFLAIAGGSLFQVIVPLTFVVYFRYHEKSFSSALILFLVGESLLNVSVYAGDAVAMQLPLLGGDDSIHDWNYLLTRLGLLKSTSTVAGAIYLLGFGAIIAAAVWAFRCSIEGIARSSSRSDESQTSQ